MSYTKFLIAAVTALALATLCATNRRYVYGDDIDQVPHLTARHVVDPRFAGTTFQVEGRVIRVGSTRQGLIFINMYQAEEDLYVDVPIFPSLGCLPLKPVAGDTVRAVGNLGLYRGKPQIKPLSVRHVEVLSAPDLSRALSVGEAVTRTGETLLVGPLSAAGLEFFTSDRGLRHLRLSLEDFRAPGPSEGAGGGVTQAVMFQNGRTNCEVTTLRSDGPFAVTAEIDTFADAPSLTVRRVVRLDQADRPRPSTR